MPAYNEIYQWVREYGKSGVPDRRAVGDYVICENDELIRRFRSQLYAVSQGNYDIEQFDKIVGMNRRIRHGSYEGWAKIMLLWLNEADKKH